MAWRNKKQWPWNRILWLFFSASQIHFPYQYADLCNQHLLPWEDLWLFDIDNEPGWPLHKLGSQKIGTGDANINQFERQWGSVFCKQILVKTYRLNRGPSLCCSLISMWIISCWMQDWDAYPAVLVDCKSLINLASHTTSYFSLYAFTMEKKIIILSLSRVDALCTKFKMSGPDTFFQLGTN